jgi:hypothetical protein
LAQPKVAGAGHRPMRPHISGLARDARFAASCSSNVEVKVAPAPYRQSATFHVEEAAVPEDDDKLPFPVLMVVVFGVVIAAIVSLLVYVAVSS